MADRSGNLLIIVKDQAADLDALSAWSVLRSLRILKSRVRSESSYTLLAIGEALAMRVKASIGADQPTFCGNVQ